MASEQHGATYIDTLVEALARGGTGTVLEYAGREIGAAEVLGTIHRYARALTGLGVGHGSLVALFAPNSPDALAIRYAANLIGAGSVFLSVPALPQRRAEMIAQADPQLLVVFPETAHLVPDGVTAPLAAVGEGVPGVRLDLLAAAERTDPVPSRARPSDLAVIISSGGTTGVPKGSWRDFAAYTAMVAVPSPPDRRQLANGKFAYLTQVLVDTTLMGGGTVVLQDHFDAALTLATIQDRRITDLFLVEPQLFELMDHPDVPTTDLTSLRALTHIGASAPATLRLRARARLGPVLAHTYGASEMGIVSALTPAEHDLRNLELFTCAGLIRPGVDVAFRRADGSAAASGEPASIEVRSPAMAGGYRNRPQLQAEHFVDGWYRTGDLGYLDDDADLHIVGRVSDVRWVDGELISPTLLQDTLCRRPEVRYAVVVVDADTGSWVAAVVPWPGAVVDAAGCHASIAAEHSPDAAAPLVVVPLERIPLTEQGKPDRPAIRLLGREAVTRVDPPGSGAVEMAVER